MSNSIAEAANWDGNGGAEASVDKPPEFIFMRIIGGVYLLGAVAMFLSMVILDIAQGGALTDLNAQEIGLRVGVMIRKVIDIGFAVLVGIGLVLARRWGRTAYLWHLPYTLFISIVAAVAFVTHIPGNNFYAPIVFTIVAVVVLFFLYGVPLLYFFGKKVRTGLNSTEKIQNLNNQSVSQHLRQITEEVVPEPAPTMPRNKRIMSMIVLGILSALYMKFRFGQETALFLIVILAIHEAGHAIAMRLVGVRLTGVFLLPIGAAVVGDDVGKRARDDVMISFGGVVFSLMTIVIAYGLLVITQWSALGTFIRMAAVLNLINLLPATALDGGRILEAIIDVRKKRNVVIIALFQLLALGIIVLLGMHLIAGILLMLSALYLVRVWRYQEVVKMLPDSKQYHELNASDAASVIDHFYKKSCSDKRKIRNDVKGLLFWRYGERLSPSQKVAAAFAFIYASQLYVLFIALVGSVMKGQ